MKNANKPAYPNPELGIPTSFDRTNDYGLTKFEKVAAMAMQGFAASANEKYGTPQEVAKDGIAAAHAFFNELRNED